MSDALSVTVVNQRSEIERLSRFVDAYGEANNLSPDLTFAMNLALDEVLTNIILHGYDDQREHTILVRLDLMDDTLSAEVEDDGRSFNPMNAPPVDVDAVIEDRPIGGLGIHIVRSTMDVLEYRRQDGRNFFIMRKRIGASRRARGASDE